MGDFTAIFTGLCGFAPDVEFADPDINKNPTKVMVLMVDAVPQDPPLIRLALDGQVLRAHAPFVLFDTADLLNRGQLPKDASAQLFVNRKQISFEIDEYPTGSNPFTVAQRAPASMEDFSYIAHVRDIIKNSSTFALKPECFQGAPSKGIISARVRLEKVGYLAAKDPDRRVEFDFAKTLGGGFVQRPLSEKASLRFVNVSQVRVVLTDLDTGDQEKIAFNTDGKLVEVTIGNLCGDSLVPLIETIALPRPAKLTRDEDFRGLYQLLDPVAGNVIKGMLNGLPLPIPVPVLVRGGGGLRNVQCMGIALNAQNFS